MADLLKPETVGDTNPKFAPGTAQGDQLATQDFRKQRTVGESVSDGLENTAAASTWRNVTNAFAEETAADPSFGAGIGGTLDRLIVGVPAALGQRGKWGESNWDKSAGFEEVTKDVPRQYWDELMSYTSKEEAMLRKGNLMDDLARGQRIGLEKGLVSAAGTIAGMLDMDLPLMFVSGGGFGVAKAAGRAAFSGAKAGLKSSVALRGAGAVAGAVQGLQAGAVVGGLDALNRDDRTWMDGVAVALTSTVFGTALGTAAPTLMLPMRQLAQDFERRVASGAPELWDDARVRATDESASVHVDEELRKPMVYEYVDDANVPDAEIVPMGVSDEWGTGYAKVRTGTPEEFEAKFADAWFDPKTNEVVYREGAEDSLAHEMVHASRANGRLSDEDLQQASDLFDELFSETQYNRMAKYGARYEKRENGKAIIQEEKAAFVVENYVRARTKGLTPEQAAAELNSSPEAKNWNLLNPDAPARTVSAEDFGRMEALYKQMSGNAKVDPNAGMIPEWRPKEAQSLSAAANQGPPVFPSLSDPKGPVSSIVTKWVTAARQWHYSTGFGPQQAAALSSTMAKWATNPLFNIGTNNVNRLVQTKSTVGNFLAGAIFEVPSGIVRGDTATAAVLKDMYLGRMMGITMDETGLAMRYAELVDKPAFSVAGKKVGISKEAMSEYNRKVYLYMNELQRTGTLRPTTDAAEQVAQDAAQMYARLGEEALAIARGKGNDVPLAGAENLPDKAAYIPYKHSGSKILSILDNTPNGDRAANRDAIIKGYADSYMSVGTFTDRKLAEAVAESVVTRAMGKATHVDDSMVMLFSADGRSFLETNLRGMGLQQKEIDGLMRKFDTDAAQRGKLSTMKSRNELDFSTNITLKDGRTIQLVDLMDDDLPTIFQRYARQMAGASALARKGIRSKSDRTDLVEAMQAEQRALGEEVMDGDLVRAMLSEFDGGAQHGYAWGMTNEGIGAVQEVKSLASLSALTFNGMAQIAETGAGIAAVGLKGWYTRGIGPIIDNAIKTKNKRVLDELAFMTGRIGQDHLVFRPHLAIDDANEFGVRKGVVADLHRFSRKWIGEGNRIQAYTSLLNIVRGKQQEIAVLGMADRVMATIKSLNADSFEEGGRMFRDLGLNRDHFDAIADLINNGTIKFDSMTSKLGTHEFVDQLNMHLWDPQLADEFAAALVRSQNQIVQKTMAGESDRWMHTQAGAALTHLQTFPILAVQKSFMRNALSRDGEAAAVAAWGLATAYAALSIRDAVTGRERDYTDRARAAIGYSNLTGWMPMYTDPVMDMFGLGDYRVNSFGPYSKPLSIPSIDIMNNMYRAPAAAIRVVTGSDSKADLNTARSLPFFKLAEAAVNMANEFGAIGEVAKMVPEVAGVAAPAPAPDSPRDKLRKLVDGVLEDQ